MEGSRHRLRSRTRGLLAVALAVIALPASAEATPLPGENGRIVFSSGRNLTDAARELFLLPVPSSTGGILSAPIASVAGQQHRHPTWSPDRTKIAYSRGAGGAPPFQIFVQDLTKPLGATNPVQITTVDGFSKDRPAWSPDGRHIAWESNAPAMQRDIIVALTNGGGQQNITNSVGFEGRPAWSPDSGTIFYEKGDSFANVNADIVKRSISGTAPALNLGNESLAVPDSGITEMQPAISPDGNKICFTLRDGNAGNTSGEVLVAPLANPSNQAIVSFDMANADYNCTFSPDSTLVAYVTGTGPSAASLVMVRADDTSLSPIPLADDAGSNNFDGNPDWAPDARPECPDTSAETLIGQPVSITVTCDDTGPDYERTNVREFITEQPQNGTAEQDLAGDPITYTPNAGFAGKDTFEIGSFDELGFGTDKGKVTVDVAGSCAGQRATITGTPGDDVLKGTPGADVIAGLEGNDRITGGKGKDLLCGGLGNDRLSGGKGKDRLIGGKGKDRLNGGKSKDSCKGGPQKDTIKACE